MTPRSLHSAVLEVGLYYQKGWSTDHIAHFTFRLNRRRLRAQEAKARARWAAHRATARAEGISYRIGPLGDPHVGFAEVMAAAEARRANQRLFDRIRAQLSRRLLRSGEQAGVAEPCWICGKPATVWTYVDRDHRVQVTDGYATCAEHFAVESPKEAEEARAS